MRIQAIALLLTLFTLSVPFASAQERAANDLLDLDLEQLMKVQFYTASKHAQNASETPASVTIVTKADIRTYGYRTLADVLRGVRGFWVNSDRNYSYLGVRGFANPRDYNNCVLLLVNGHRLNDNVYDGALIGTEFPLDLDLVDRIEIVRGPGSSLYGANALFGVINVITLQPSNATAVEVSAEAASEFTRKARITLTLPQILDGAILSASMYRSNGNHRLYFPEFDSPDTNNGVARGMDGDSYGSAFSLIRWKHFQLQSLLGSREKTIPTASFNTIFNDPENRTRDAHGFAELSYLREFASALRVSSRWFYDASFYRGTYTYKVDGSRQVFYDRARGDWVGTETNLSRPLGSRNTLTAGIEFRFNLRQAQTNGWNISPIPVLDSHRQSSLFALYAQDELRVTRLLTVNAGLRLDQYSTFGVTLSPRIAAIFHADQKTAIKYSIGRAFRAPNAYEQFYSDRESQEPSQGLHAEKLTSQNLSVERVFSPAFRVVAEAFYSALSQTLVPQLDPATGMYHYMNSSSSSGRGLEFELDAQHKGMRGELSYTAQRSIGSIDGLTRAVLQTAPQHIGKINVHIPLSSALVAGLGLRFQSPQLTQLDTKIPNTVIADLSISSRKPVLGFDLNASCYNLLNRRNYDPPAPSLSETRVLQDSRGFRLQVSRTFPRK